ncbi:MAG: cob(I)yrinic acid a,c-diamide adenosyltransferase [Deltaproteobacteria bacterium]
MAIRINRVYTRTGDGGQTRLVGGAAVSKDCLRVEAYGTVDELNSILGVARAFNDQPGATTAPAAQAELAAILEALQNELFDLGSELATPPADAWEGMITIAAAEVEGLEKTIDRCQEDLEDLESFILPAGGHLPATLHHARTVCRRAERDVIRLKREEEVGAELIKYLNRLSDLLFVLARWVSKKSGIPEVLWEKGLRLGEAERRAKMNRD